jgi:hypothetical protein
MSLAHQAKADVRPAPSHPYTALYHGIFELRIKYLGFEQSGDGGTHHRTIPYPYFGGYPMSPYRL